MSRSYTEISNDINSTRIRARAIEVLLADLELNLKIRESKDEYDKLARRWPNITQKHKYNLLIFKEFIGADDCELNMKNFDEIEKIFIMMSEPMRGWLQQMLQIETTQLRKLGEELSKI